jgi:thiol-disulfide isomerase/thioredoxin
MTRLTRFFPILLIGLISATALAKRAPSVELKDLAGHKQKLADLRGKIVVLSFWATWCGPCKEELPRLSQLSGTFEGKNVSFVAVSIDKPKDVPKVAPFLDQQKISLPVWIGGDEDLLARFGLGDIVPGTVILDEQGEIVGRIMGEAQDDDVRSRVDWLLKGRPGTPPDAVVKRY